MIIISIKGFLKNLNSILVYVIYEVYWIVMRIISLFLFPIVVKSFRIGQKRHFFNSILFQDASTSDSSEIICQFKLEKQAKSSGGDKYISSDEPFNGQAIYLPQSISRVDQTNAAPKLRMKLSTYDNSGTKIVLASEAKKGGADKYETGEIVGFNLYVPQAFSRRDGKIIENLYVDIKSS